MTAQAAPFHAIIPSISTVNDFWPESKQLIAVPHDLQRTISSPTSAIYIGFNLLVALSASARWRSQSALFKQQSSWVSDICDELWHYFRRWTTGSNKRPLHDETIALYMQLVETFAVPELEPRDHSSTLRKAASMAISSVAHLIENLATSPMSDSNQTQLALMVTRLRYLAQPDVSQRSALDPRHETSKAFCTEMLKQSATIICKNTEVLSGLQKDLQVCATRYCMIHVVDSY